MPTTPMAVLIQGLFFFPFFFYKNDDRIMSRIINNEGLSECVLLSWRRVRKGGRVGHGGIKDIKTKEGN